jgi:predicted transcriptional regulator
MLITVNYEVVEKIINIINMGNHTDYDQFIDGMQEVNELTGMTKMLDYYKNIYDYKQYCDILYKALNQIEFTTADEQLEQIYINLRRITHNTARLNNKLKLIKEYDFNKLEDKLVKKLPKGTNMDVDIFFTFDALNGGTIIGNNTMMLNVMFWPSEDKYLDLIEGILLHEYHHIGLKYWVDKSHGDIHSYDDKFGLIRLLMLSILGEGAATYFYNDGDDIYPLAVESHGEEMANAIRDSMANRGDHIKRYLSDLEDDIHYINSFDGSISELNSIRNKYTYSSTSEPLDKSIGYHMCEQIDKNLGTRKLIECFNKPELFVHHYNEALNNEKSLRLSDQFIKLINMAFV